MLKNNKTIWTFWEPRRKLPNYLKLCMETWKKFLPEYDIVLLDYSNVDDYLGKGYYDDTLYKNFSLPKQADAIRCAVLKRYGGVWLDTDTIITSEKVKDIFNINSELILLHQHIGFIVAKPNAEVLCKWEYGIKKRIATYKNYQNNPVKKLLYPILRKRYLGKMERWNYLGNGILGYILRDADENHFHSVDRLAIRALPEVNWAQENAISYDDPIKVYIEFYFENELSDYVLNATAGGGVVYLHNSWTPEKYRKMSKNNFLKQNFTLANILKKLLI
ncbi:hypothetical protein RsTz2092_11450 [Deferribacterales bacterium RsTz2092]|nr:hypothetical protein AGMMS49941_05590 [Deferribacterales bacterium]GHU85591.1 hypothetical protein AGMMS49941_05680 [Deferribacterales bacterium]